MKLTKTLLTSTLLATSIFSFQSTAWADVPKETFELGALYYSNGDYQTSLKLWQPLAENGYAEAQYALGVMYFQGEGVKQDYAKAVKWYTKAAEQGMAKAQVRMGEAYLDGIGVKQDNAKAVKFFSKAAEQGDVGAQTILGAFYEGKYFINVVERDLSKAKEWFSKACDNGGQDACNALRELEK